MATGEPPDPKLTGFFASGGAGGSANAYQMSDATVSGWSTSVDLGPQTKLETATLKLASDIESLPCSFCGSKKTGQFIFNDKDQPETRLCSGCLTKAVSWVIAQAKGGLAVREAPADRKACEKCHRHYMPEHLHLVGKKNPVTLCDPCYDQFADSAAEALGIDQRNIIL